MRLVVLNLLAQLHHLRIGLRHDHTDVNLRTLINAHFVLGRDTDTHNNLAYLDKTPRASEPRPEPPVAVSAVQKSQIRPAPQPPPPVTPPDCRTSFFSYIRVNVETKHVLHLQQRLLLKTRRS